MARQRPWRDNAIKANTWSDNISIYEADGLGSFEKSVVDASEIGVNYAVIDTGGGGSKFH